MFNRFEKAALISTFIGAGVVIAASSYGLVFPHPVSMFFGWAYKITTLGVAWALISVFVFVGAMLVRILRLNQ